MARSVPAHSANAGKGGHGRSARPLQNTTSMKLSLTLLALVATVSTAGCTSSSEENANTDSSDEAYSIRPSGGLVVYGGSGTRCTVFERLGASPKPGALGTLVYVALENTVTGNAQTYTFDAVDVMYATLPFHAAPAYAQRVSARSGVALPVLPSNFGWYVTSGGAGLGAIRRISVVGPRSSHAYDDLAKRRYAVGTGHDNVEFCSLPIPSPGSAH